MTYNELVEAYFFTPEHVGIIDLTQPFSVYYHGGEKARGHVFDLYMQCQGNGFIEKMCFKAYGNPYLLAAAEWLCRQMEGSMLKEHPRIHYSLLVEQLAIPATRYPLALQIADAYKELITRMKAILKEV